MIYICNFHVLNHLLLIYICKLHWNRSHDEIDALYPKCCGDDLVFTNDELAKFVYLGQVFTPDLSQLNQDFSPQVYIQLFLRPKGSTPHSVSSRRSTTLGNFLLIYICNFHVLSHLLMIYICKLHWNLNTMFVCQVISL